MPKVFGLPVPRRLVNAVVTPLVRLGLGPRDIHLLSVPGRRTGRVYRTPVSVLRRDGERWLVAPYGERSWVKNARAAGWVELRRGRRTERVRVQEVAPERRAEILRAYVRKVPLTREFFAASPEASVETFAAEADQHPVLRLETPAILAGPVSETIEASRE